MNKRHWCIVLAVVLASGLVAAPAVMAQGPTPTPIPGDVIVIPEPVQAPTYPMVGFGVGPCRAVEAANVPVSSTWQLTVQGLDGPVELMPWYVDFEEATPLEYPPEVGERYVLHGYVDWRSEVVNATGWFSATNPVFFAPTGAEEIVPPNYPVAFAGISPDEWTLVYYNESPFSRLVKVWPQAAAPRPPDEFRV